MNQAKSSFTTMGQSCPDYIYARHWQEWLASAVDPDIIALNVHSMEGQRPYEYLCYSPLLPRTNTGRLAAWVLNRYTHTEHGGWWCDGLDPFDSWQPMRWGCFKPDKPVRDERGKLVKYEHPFKIGTRAFFLRVSLQIWRRVAHLYNKPVPDNIVVTADGEALGFWAWVLENNIPITITEGAKKAGALLTAGYAAIALPGIDGGYRAPKDEAGNKIGRSYLLPELKHFATKGRRIYFCFDRDSKRKTVRNVNRAITTCGKLLTQLGCDIWVISWQQPEKGVDDFLFCHGSDLFEQVTGLAASWDTWLGRSYTQLAYAPDILVNRRYLGEISIPLAAQLVAVKSPKGTGKTHLLESVVTDAIANGQWVLVVGHRVQLVEALCHRFGIPYITEVRTSETGSVLGYGLCVDSLHPQSQARFNADNWHDGVVIIDECEQVIWHALNSNTCQTSRVAILQQLKTLLSNVLQGNGRVFLADADLSDLSIDFVRSLSGYDTEPTVIVNQWLPGPEERCNIHNYTGKNPSALVAALETHINNDGKPFIVCSAQKAKSNWGTRTLESHLQNLFNDKRILRIDSETISDPSHPAYGCIANLNEILPHYDIVLASPSIETGVSIDLKQHFTSVWGIFQGVQSSSSARQALFRLREPVERHIWAAPYGIGKISNGSTSVKSLLASQHKLAKANIRLLQEAELDDIELNFQPESLRIWAQMAVGVNLGMIDYRQSILTGLKAEGHQIVAASVAVNDAVKCAVTDTKEQNHRAEASAIASAPEISSVQYEQLQEQKAKTQAQRHSQRKHLLEKRYSIPVDASLVLKDDDGWYAQIKLHYYLTVGRQFLKGRDVSRLMEQSEQGNGALWQPDLNRTQVSVSVAALENLGLLELLIPNQEWRSSDQVLQQMAMLALAHAWDIKAALNITISEKDTPIAIAQKLLGKVGLKLEYLRREGSDGERMRVYGYTAPSDGRDEVFAAWMARDEANATVDFTSTPGNKEITNSSMDMTKLDTAGV